jgi:hypothetical protein
MDSEDPKQRVDALIDVLTDVVDDHVVRARMSAVEIMAALTGVTHVFLKDLTIAAQHDEEASEARREVSLFVQMMQQQSEKQLKDVLASYQAGQGVH